MVSRNIYLQLILRTIFISGTAMVMAYFFFKTAYITALFFLFLLVVQNVLFIRYINQTNRKIAYFFDAIKNEDFTLRFPEKLSVKSLEELNHSLNMLNSMIQEIHIKKQAQEQYYQEILRQADMGIFTINPKGHILYANPMVQTLLNYYPLNHIKQLTQVDNNLYKLFEGIEPFEKTVIELTTERERKLLSIKCTSLNIEDDTLLLVIVHDIHKELDEKETDSWVKLIRVLTHEIMNTITPITSISESILKYFRKGDSFVPITDFKDHELKNTAKGLEVIKEQGKDLMSFVQSYRKFLSIPEPDKEIVPANKLLNKIQLLLDSDEASRNIAIETNVHPQDLDLFIDEKQITQVLLNLGKNAKQSLGNQENALLKLTAGLNKKGEKIIQVWDNGPGISPELLDEIFVPFFTTKKTGTGIGLSLSKQIMRLHGGSIQVISRENTAFTLSFP
ncbi:MAG: histidine kinase [Maribacter sp.]|nr:histidine kinase [Maribacter sp.]